MKKLFQNKNFWSLVIVFVFAILASRTLIFQRGYFNMHDDLQMMRQLEMEKCFLDGQIPCRWIPDMGYGFGFPLFNFYPPLPYLIGEVFRVVGLSFVEVAKLTFTLSFLVSGVTMYFLAKEFFGRKGGVVASIFYVWAPYHAVDVYVRGAMNESWGLAWFPLIFLCAYKLITDDKKKIKFWVISLALSWFALLTSHNLMVLIFGPFFAIWCLIWLYRQKKWNLIPHLAISGVVSLGLSAFFTFPAVLENKFTWLKSQLVGYYDYSAHFVDLNQLFISRFWGYGPSVWDVKDDGMSFQVGHFHWILPLIIFGVFAYKYIKNKKIDNILIIVGFLFFMGWFAAFMTHVRSTFIYQAIPTLGLVQFSWRFLTLIIFAFSFLIGSLALIVKGRMSKIILGILALSLVVFNWNYFLPQHGKMGKLTDQEKFSGAAWDLQQTAGIYDYLPSTAKEAPKGPQKVLAEFMEGEGFLSEMKQGTDWATFKTTITTEKALVRVNIFKFPGWKATMDGKEIETLIPETEKWGRMWIEIPKGDHTVYVEFTNTPVRSISNMVSLISWVSLLAFVMLQSRGGNKRRTLRSNI